MNNNMELRMREDVALVEYYLSKVLERGERYAQLQEAMAYSLMAGGKRIRPVLALETCRMCGGRREDALPLGCAVEMVHTYSLIHDDLPCMDDDDLRRGRPTNHKVYGEAMAVLAGDGLLTGAFQVLVQEGASLSHTQLLQAVECLACAAGAWGMVGGQALDMDGEGKELSLTELERLQTLKTGALISAAAEMGVIAAGGSQEQRQSVRRYAQALGRAFQIRDDMLDVISSDQELGKPVGSDAANGKSTFVTALGLEGCRQEVERLTREAEEALTGFAQPEFLIWLSRRLAGRRS